MGIYSNYWNCNKVADWVRGIAKPESASASEWVKWEKLAKSSHPVRYWIVETLFRKLQNFVNWPYDKFHAVRYYINNRWVTKSHALTAHPSDIKPGQWQDVGYRFLPCLFNELVDFVEIEQAWKNVLWDEEARKRYNVPWWRTSFLKWRTWRCPEAGLEYLDWAASLTNADWVDESDPTYGQPSPQAESAKEIKELYLWWTQVYKNRPDPYDASGWSEICDRKRGESIMAKLDDSNESPEEATEKNKSLKTLREIEQQYDQEEEEMLIRLIKIRRSLWT